MRQSMKKNKYFGTDGIRGIPNDTISVDFLVNLGKAIEVLNCKKILIGTDTRISKDMLSTAIISGCLSRGIDVYYAKVVSTPMVMYYTYTHQMTGLILTASHNPFMYNGIKIVENGKKISEEKEREIEQRMDNPVDIKSTIGRIYKIDIEKEYLDFVFRFAKPTNLKICLDCANGAMYKTAPFVFSKICGNLSIIGNEPNGININDRVGATSLEALRETILRQHCDIGIAYDGDGDRVILIDHKGNVVDGDKILYLFAIALQKNKKLNHQKVVTSVMSNLGLKKKLKEKGISTIEVPVGDKNITDKIEKEDLSLGGESSGHIILSEILPFGDGLINSLLVLSILQSQKKTLWDLTEIPMYPSRLINIENTGKIKEKNLDLRIKEMEESLNYDCKIIVRPSGTENVIRVFVMAEKEEIVERYSKEIIEYWEGKKA